MPTADLQPLLLVANWKMNGLLCESMQRFKETCQKLSKEFICHDIVLCPPFTLLRDFAEKTPGTDMKLGAQNCSHEKEGSYTGEISAQMLKDMTCEYVILGHSERRHYQHEQSDLVRQKALAAHQSNLIPIICVGETLYEREHKLHKDALKQQLDLSIPETASDSPIVIAYEPVWAIGTNKIPSADEIKEAHHYISDVFSQRFPESKCRVIYGGSVNASNSKELLQIPGVNGLLIGRASLDVDQFVNIIKSAL